MSSKTSGIVLITGGASGIGAASARILAAKGYDVAVNYRTRELEARLLVDELRRRGARALAVQADIAVPEDVERLYREVDEQMGRVDAVINSAGIGIRPHRVDATEATKLETLFRTNVLGLILSCREAVRRMSTERGGSGGVIVNVSSMAATIGGRPGASLYAASKGAVDAFTVGLAKEVAREGIRAISVRPGFTLTEMTAPYVQDPKRLEHIAETIPMGRPGQADEVAGPIAWLLSAEASFITGALFDISGGGFLQG